MSEQVLSTTERRLQRTGVKITFFKALVKTQIIERRYPQGLEGFIEVYKRLTPRSGLIGVTFPTKDALQKFADDMMAHDIVQGRDFATADQLHGERVACEGIRFSSVPRLPNRDAAVGFPVWYAFADACTTALQ